jgi:hypothetical protein
VGVEGIYLVGTTNVILAAGALDAVLTLVGDSLGAGVTGSRPSGVMVGTGDKRAACMVARRS